MENAVLGPRGDGPHVYPTPDGYCGDEDNGQTSAWYVFSAMGFYPVAPGTDEYALGSPLFKKITINLENGKKWLSTLRAIAARTAISMV